MNLITGSRIALRQVSGLHAPLLEIPSLLIALIALVAIPGLLIALVVIPSLLFALVVIPGLLVAIIRQLFEFALKSDHVLDLDKVTKLGVRFVLHEVNDLSSVRSF